jgi:hypothetical protein
VASGITIAEFDNYRLAWFGHPERHFIIYKNEVAIVMTKYEKEAIATFSELRKKYENT